MAQKKITVPSRSNPKSVSVDFLTTTSRVPVAVKSALMVLSKSQKVFFILLFIVAIIKSGIWVFPAINASLMIARNPFINPFLNPGDQYLMTTWLGSYLLNIFGIKSIAGVIWFFLTCGIFSLFVLWFTVKKHVPSSLRARSVTFMALVPAVSMVFYWIGMDTFTFLLFSLFLYFSKNAYATFAIGILLGMQHFEIGFGGGISLVVYQVLSQRSVLKNRNLMGASGFVGGLVLGEFLLRWIFAGHDIVIKSNRTSIGLETVKTNKNVIIGNIVPIYWSLFGTFWLLIALLVKRYDREIMAFLVALIIPMAIVFFVKDQSRIMQLSSFILIMQAVVLNPNQLRKLKDLHIRIILLLWLIFPWVWFWGSTRYSVIGFDIRYLISRVQHNDLAPWNGSITMWPFS